MSETLRVVVGDDYALSVARRLLAVGAIPEATCVEILVDDRLRLAQSLRVIRDTGCSEGSFVHNVCVRALAECGITDPDEDHL